MRPPTLLFSFSSIFSHTCLHTGSLPGCVRTMKLTCLVTARLPRGKWNHATLMCSAVLSTTEWHHSRKVTSTLIKLFQKKWHLFLVTLSNFPFAWESEGDVHWKSSFSQNYPGTFYLVPWADDKEFDLDTQGIHCYRCICILVYDIL